jgi:multidrug resistance efflux pump
VVTSTASRAINVANAQAASQGIANVNPIFTWVRLAQRIPVRVHIDEVPTGIVLAAGMTATVEIDDRSRTTKDTRLGSTAKSM